MEHIDETHEEAPGSIDDAYRQARHKRRAEEWVALNDKAEANAKLLAELRLELQQAQAQNSEHRVTLAEKNTKLEQVPLLQVNVNELTALSTALQSVSDQQKETIAQLQQQSTQDTATATSLLNKQMENLSLEEQRTLELSTTVKTLQHQVSQLEIQLTAGRKAMQTMQAKILGKSGQRLAIMAVDLEQTVAEFQNKQDRLAAMEIELNRKDNNLNEREIHLKEGQAQLATDTLSYNKRLKALVAREKKVSNWKQYATMQENAFERRDSELDKIGQQQELHARENEAREESVQTRENNAMQEEEHLHINREELTKLGNHIRAQQYSLETRAQQISAVTRLQKLVRQMLVKRATKSVMLANARQTELDQREKNVAVSESTLREARQQVGTLQIKVSVQDSTNERHAKILDTREEALLRRQTELVENEKRQRALEMEVEQRHVVAIKRETEVGTVRSNLFERESTVESREKQINALELTIKNQREALALQQKDIDNGLTQLNEQKKGLVKQENEMENKLNAIVVREEVLARHELKVQQDTERVTVEWEEARVARDDNEHQAQGLLDAKEEYYRMKEAVRKNNSDLKEREHALLQRENDAKQIGPRESAVEMRETKQTEREFLFYENTAAKVHNKQKEQIKTLEQCLEQEIHANQKLQLTVKELRTRGGGGVEEEEGDEKVDVGLALWTSEKGTNNENYGSSPSPGGSPSGSPGGRPSGSPSSTPSSSPSNAKNTETKQEGFSSTPAPGSVGRLHRARSMLCHLIDDQSRNDVSSPSKRQEDHSGGNKKDNSTGPRTNKRNKLDVRAERNFRRSLYTLDPNAKYIVSGGLSSGSPTKTWSLPWNTWFRVVGGRQEQGLSLQLFRHLLRRRTKISNSAVPDQDVRRVFDLIDVKRVGYIRLEDFITWLNGATRMGGKIRVGEESNVSTTIQLGGAQDDVIDVTVTL